jgi:hypothetical protein
VKFRLDKSRVPPDKREDRRLSDLEVAFLSLMEDASLRLRVCLHEAAHAIYAERCGAVRVAFFPPLAVYDANTDSFSIASAAVQPNFGSGVTIDSLRMARWYVAGSVAERTLTAGATLRGNEQDFEVFSAQARKLGMSAREIREHWKQATRDVKRDLRSPAFRNELWRRAHDFMRQLEAAMQSPR